VAKQLGAAAHAPTSEPSSAVQCAPRAIGVCLAGLRRGPAEGASGDDAEVWLELDGLAARHRIRLVGVRLPARSGSVQRVDVAAAGAFDAVIELSTLRLPADQFDSDVHVGSTGAESVIAALAAASGIAGMRPAQEAPLSAPADATPTNR